MEATPLFEPPAPVRRAPKVGDAWTEIRRLVAHLGRLASVDADAAGVMVAWEQMARCPVIWPAFTRHAPSLGVLEGADALAGAWEALAVVWPHLAEHGENAVYALRRVSPADWTRVVEDLEEPRLEVMAEVTGHAHYLGLPDLGGECRQQLRPRAAVDRLGAFYTPENLASFMAAVAGANEGREAWLGRAVLEPAVGTGRLLTASVLACAEAGADPQSVGWFGVDLDGVALVIAGLNLVTAGAGPHVWLHRGNGLETIFVGPNGPMAFDLVLSNPPFVGREDPSKLTADPVEVDPAARRAAWPDYGEAA